MDRIEDFEVNSPRWLSLENFEGEVWKDVPDYIGLYKASNYGRIKSLDNVFIVKNRWGGMTSRKKKGLIIKQIKNINGYLTVNLHKYGVLTTHFVHKVVARTFIPNPQNKQEVDHINTIKNDNKLRNLRWVTKSENMLNPITLWNNKVNQGEPVVVLNCWGEYIGEYIGAKEAAREMCISDSVVFDTIKGDREARTTSGYLILYKKDYDPQKDYSVIYKKYVRKYRYIPNEKMVLQFKDGILNDVFCSVDEAAEYYDAHASSIKQRIRKCNRGDTSVIKKDIAKIFDELHYLIDVPKDVQDAALKLYKIKYPIP